MRRNNLSIGVKSAFIILSLSVCAAHAGVGTEKTLHSFNNRQGSHPSGVILGPDGNIYGTTVLGGGGAGTVYELTPAAGGRWLETRVIDIGRKGAYPNNPIFDAEGNLFGTTELGSGCGSIYELTLDSAGHWRETVLHGFDCSEGLYPESPLLRDSAGNLYGTAWGGGSSGNGTVYELFPGTGGSWTFKLLHSFSGTDGAHLQSAPAIDASGNLYGTALCGGTSAQSSVAPIKAEFPPRLRRLSRRRHRMGAFSAS